MRRLLLRLFPWIPSPGLGSKIFWAVLALTLVAVTLMAVVVDRLAGKILRERVERELALRADRTVREISLYLEEQSSEAVGLAQVQTVKEVLAALDRGDIPAFERARAEAEEFLLAYQGHKKPIQAIRLVDAGGFVLLKIKEGAIVPHRIAHPGKPVWGVFHVEGKDSFRMAISQPEASTWLSNFELGKEDPVAAEFCPAMFRYSTPLFDGRPGDGRGTAPADGASPGGGGRRLGVLIVNFWGEKIGEVVRDGIDSATGYALLAERNGEDPNRDGVFLVHPDPQAVFGNQTGDPRRLAGDPTAGWVRQAASAEGDVYEHPGTGDILVHRYYSPYLSETRGWDLVFVAERAKVLAPVANLRRVMAAVWIVFVVASALAVPPLSRSLVRPVKRLVDAVNRVDSPGPHPPVPVETGDEIGELGRAYNRMLTRLHASQVERERAESRVRQAEKLASIGEFAAGVAHEINNPLHNIISLAKLARRDLGGREGAAERDLSQIAQEGERCGRIVRGVLTFSRKYEPIPEPTRLAEVAREAAAAVREECEARGVSIDVKAAEEISEIAADRGQIRQVVENVLRNAVQASGWAQTVTIRVDGAGRPGVQTIEVVDRGCGIAPEHLPRVFDPFFTTKPVGAGTGLGLSVCYGIVQAHGGTIRIESRPGEETRCTIALPAAVRGVSPPAPTSAAT
ncbi:MAG: sensor histidine kinase [Nitrospirae bacterium]|nr:sensor histidine kinase [Nitrospirota bacterium]